MNNAKKKAVMKYCRYGDYGLFEHMLVFVYYHFKVKQRKIFF